MCRGHLKKYSLKLFLKRRVICNHILKIMSLFVVTSKNGMWMKAESYELLRKTWKMSDMWVRVGFWTCVKRNIVTNNVVTSKNGMWMKAESYALLRKTWKMSEMWVILGFWTHVKRNFVPICRNVKKWTGSWRKSYAFLRKTWKVWEMWVRLVLKRIFHSVESKFCQSLNSFHE